MTSNELMTLLGFAISAAGLVSLLIWRDRQNNQRHADDVETLRVLVRNGDAELHARINKVKDEYARKDDLSSHFSRIDQELSELRKTTSRGNEMLGQLLLYQAQNTQK